MAINILMLIDRYHPIWGGAENQLRQLAHHLPNENYNITILTRRWHFNMPRTDNVDDIRVIRVGLPGTNVFSTLSYCLGVARFIIFHHKSIDIIHSHGAVALGALGRFLAHLIKAHNIAKIASAGRIPEMQKSVVSRSLLKSFNRSDIIICLTEEIEGELKSIGVPDSKICRTPNAVDSEKFKPLDKNVKCKKRRALGIDENDIVVLFSSRLVPRKGGNLLLEAWTHISSMHPQAHLIILGSGENQKDSIEKQLRQFIQTHNFKNIHMQGNVNDPELFYGLGDIFAFPSKKEGMPNALLEAMSCALAPVSFQIGGVKNLIKDGETGLLVEPYNVNKFAERIIELIEDIDKRKRIGQKAREYVREEFTFSKITQQYISLYKQYA